MNTLAVKVQKRFGERVRSILYEENFLNRAFQIRVSDDYLEIPVRSDLPEHILKAITPYDIQFVELVEPKARNIPAEPFEEIEARLDLPAHLKKLLPRKWELIGNVLILKLHEDLEPHREDLAAVYAAVLGAGTVLQELSGITGITRKPDMEVIYGSSTVTIHTENSIKYKLDAKELMFSSGNISERLRMAELDCRDEVIVDMFAGIGYFSLPLAVYGKPRRVISCEINPVSFEYLKQNIDLNGVSDRVEPLLGDCRKTAPTNTADRLVMGLIKDTASFLPVALKVLKTRGGIIHFHHTCPADNIPAEPLTHIENAARGTNFKVELLNSIKIKSYAPGISHVVLDVKLVADEL